MRESDFQPLETKDFLILAVIMGVFLSGCWFIGSLLVKGRDPQRNTRHSSTNHSFNTHARLT
jgi:hypothetical protein